MLSEKMVETIEKYNFKVSAHSINNDLVIAGNVYFKISHNSLPLIPNPFARHEVLEPFNVFQDSDGSGPCVCINISNRNMPNHDFWVLHSMSLIVQRMDVSTMTMKFLDGRGHGLYGMPKNMKASYEMMEKVASEAKNLVKELATFVK